MFPVTSGTARGRFTEVVGGLTHDQKARVEIDALLEAAGMVRPPSLSRQKTRAGTTKTCRIALAVAATVACLASATPASAVELTSCAGAYVEPTGFNLPDLGGATLCLLNEERAERGLDPLRSSGALQTVAEQYAWLMVTRSFFDHVGPQGSTFIDRIKQSDYLDAGDGFFVGENLAWGGGPLATPERIVYAWMDSPAHRANILNGRFRAIGIGVAFGVPVADGGQGATYVNEFGMRS